MSDGTDDAESTAVGDVDADEVNSAGSADGRTVVVLLCVIVVLLAAILTVQVLDYRRSDAVPFAADSSPVTVVTVATLPDAAAPAGTGSVDTQPEPVEDVDPRMTAVFTRWSESAPAVADVFAAIDPVVITDTAMNLCSWLNTQTLDEYFDDQSDRIDRLVADPSYGLNKAEWIEYYTAIADEFCGDSE